MNKKLFRILSVLLLAAVSLAALAGCAAALPEGFDEAVVNAAAENVIDVLNQRDVDGLEAVLNDRMKAQFTDEILAQIFAALDDSGDFVEIEGMTLTSTTENETTYGVAVARAAYANRVITYTITFDAEMKLAGLFLR